MSTSPFRYDKSVNSASSNNNNNNERSITVESKVKDVLQRMKDNISQSEVMKTCFGILSVLSRDKANKTAVIKDGIEIVLNAMSSNMEKVDVQESGCDLLWSLAFNDITTKEAIADHNGASVLVRSLKRHNKSAEFLKSACGAISNICQFRPNQEGFTAHGGLQPLVGVIQTHCTNDQLLPYLFDAIASLIVGNEENGKNVSQLGYIPAVLGSIVKYKTINEVAKSGCHSLAILSDIKGQACKIAYAGGVQTILALLDIHPSFIALHRVAAVVLLRMLQESNHVAREIPAHEGIRILLKSLEHGGAQNDTVAAVTHILFVVTNPSNPSASTIESQLWLASDHTIDAANQISTTTSNTQSSSVVTTETALKGILMILDEYSNRRDIVRTICRFINNIGNLPGIVSVFDKFYFLDKLLVCVNIHHDSRDIVECTSSVLKAINRRKPPILQKYTSESILGLLHIFRTKISDDETSMACSELIDQYLKRVRSLSTTTANTTATNSSNSNDNSLVQSTSYRSSISPKLDPHSKVDSNNTSKSSSNSNNRVDSISIHITEDIKLPSGKSWEEEALSIILIIFQRLCSVYSSSSNHSGTDIHATEVVHSTEQRNRSNSTSSTISTNSTTPNTVGMTKYTNRLTLSLISCTKELLFDSDTRKTTNMIHDIVKIMGSILDVLLLLLHTPSMNKYGEIIPKLEDFLRDYPQYYQHKVEKRSISTGSLITDMSPTNTSSIQKQSDTPGRRPSTHRQYVISPANRVTISSPTTPRKLIPSFGSSSSNLNMNHSSSSTPRNEKTMKGISTDRPSVATVVNDRNPSNNIIFNNSNSHTNSHQSVSDESSSYQLVSGNKSIHSHNNIESNVTGNRTSEDRLRTISSSSNSLVTKQGSRNIFSSNPQDRYYHINGQENEIVNIMSATGTLRSALSSGPLLDTWPNFLEKLCPPPTSIQKISSFQSIASSLQERLHIVYDSKSAAGLGLQSRILSPPYPYTIPRDGIGSKFTHSIVFDSEFESGNLQMAIQRGETEYDLFLRPDLHTIGHTQWFYFAVSNTHPKDQSSGSTAIKFNVVNLTKPDSLFNLGMRPVVYSSKDSQSQGIGWIRSGRDISYTVNSYDKFASSSTTVGNNSSVTFYTLSFTLEFHHHDDRVLIAYTYPFTLSDYQRHIQSILSRPNASERIKIQPLCKTLGGQICDLLVITDFTQDKDRIGWTTGYYSLSDDNLSSILPVSGVGISGSNISRKKETSLKSMKSLSLRPALFFSARVHPGETPASWMMKGIIDFLISDSPEATLLRQLFVIFIVPVLNPDGVSYGNNRCSLAGVDLNRQWKNPDRVLHPTIYHLKALMTAQKRIREVYMYIDLHGHSRKYNVFMYGCDPLDSSIKKKSSSTLTSSASAKYQVRSFPRALALHEIGRKYVSFSDCSFHVNKGREATARVVVARELGICYSYTLEATFCGANYGPLKYCHMNIGHLLEIGSSLCAAILEFAIRDQTIKECFGSNIPTSCHGNTSSVTNSTGGTIVDINESLLPVNEDADDESQNSDDEVNEIDEPLQILSLKKKSFVSSKRSSTSSSKHRKHKPPKDRKSSKYSSFSTQSDMGLSIGYDYDNDSIGGIGLNTSDGSMKAMLYIDRLSTSPSSISSSNTRASKSQLRNRRLSFKDNINTNTNTNTTISGNMKGYSRGILNNGSFALRSSIHGQTQENGQSDLFHLSSLGIPTNGGGNSSNLMETLEIRSKSSGYIQRGISKYNDNDGDGNNSSNSNLSMEVTGLNIITNGTTSKSNSPMSKNTIKHHNGSSVMEFTSILSRRDGGDDNSIISHDTRLSSSDKGLQLPRVRI